TVGRVTVGKYRVHDFLYGILRIRHIKLRVNTPATLLPCREHRGEGFVLGELETGESRAVPAIPDEPDRRLPRGDSSCPAPNCLEIVIRYSAQRDCRIEHHGAHPVTAGDVPSPALGHASGDSSKRSAHRDRVGVIPFDRYKENIVCRSRCPDTGYGILWHHYHHRLFVLRREPSKGPAGVSRRGDDRYFLSQFPESLQGGQGLEFLERTGGEGGILFREVPGK